MYERTYGYRYSRTRSAKEDAAMIRADIKALVKAGMLPSDWKYSVRYRSFAGGCAIDVEGISPRPTYLMDPGMLAAPRDAERDVTIPHRVNDRERFGSVWCNLRMRPGEVVDLRWCDCQTDEARQVLAALEDLHNAYNHDGSDSMVDYFDVKFYGRATLDVLPGVARSERERPSYLPEQVQ